MTIKKLLSFLAVATLLTATIHAESLWADEAFSAFIASHRSLAACWATLAGGDSSDLQMIFYYLYLHVWSQVFGQSEAAFRSANIPFILLYSGVLVWASYRLFNSRWAWAVAALAPLSLSFANETRPYFDIMAFSLTCVACLLAYLREPSERERKVLPWLVLGALLLGATFHMLMLLVGVPLVALVGVALVDDKRAMRWQDWKLPLLCLTPVGLGLLVYFSWTFGRGLHYDYAKPDSLSMASVVFRFAGLSGYAPNRRYDIPFRPYAISMALSAAALALGLGALFLAQRKSSDKRCFRALAFALAVGMIEICLLSIVMKQQIEFRHTSSLLPPLVLLVMAGLSTDSIGEGRRKFVVVAAAAISITWLISDMRLTFSPDYGREDFRGAVRTAIGMGSGKNAAIAVVADPVATAYYGLDMKGPQPCFPLTDSCQEGFSKVTWPKDAEAQYALSWSTQGINNWLEAQRQSKRPVVVLISRSRHPMIKGSAWWPVLQEHTHESLHPVHGFFVYLLR